MGQLRNRAATPAQDGCLGCPIGRPAGCRRRSLVFLQGEGAAALIQRAALGGRVPPCLAHRLRRMHAVPVCCLPGELMAGNTVQRVLVQTGKKTGHAWQGASRLPAACPKESAVHMQLKLNKHAATPPMLPSWQHILNL